MGLGGVGSVFSDCLWKSHVNFGLARVSMPMLSTRRLRTQDDATKKDLKHHFN